MWSQLFYGAPILPIIGRVVHDHTLPGRCGVQFSGELSLQGAPTLTGWILHLKFPKFHAVITLPHPPSPQCCCPVPQYFTKVYARDCKRVLESRVAVSTSDCKWRHSIGVLRQRHPAMIYDLVNSGMYNCVC